MKPTKSNICYLKRPITLINLQLGTKKMRKKTIVNIRNERVGITTDNMNIKKILKENYEQINVHKFDNLDKVAKPLKVKICLNS